MDKNKIVFLTSAICENDDETTRPLLEQHGLVSGSYICDDKGSQAWYPLSLAESQFIGDDPITLPDGPMVLLGYSIYAEGRKYIAPTIEIYFDYAVATGEKPAPTFEQAESIECHYLAFANSIARITGGFVFTDETYDGLCVSIAIPFSFLNEKYANVPMGEKFNEHKKWLEEQLTASTVTV